MEKVLVWTAVKMVMKMRGKRLDQVSEEGGSIWMNDEETEDTEEWDAIMGALEDNNDSGKEGWIIIPKIRERMRKENSHNLDGESGMEPLVEADIDWYDMIEDEDPDNGVSVHREGTRWQGHTNVTSGTRLRVEMIGEGERWITEVEERITGSSKHVKELLENVDIVIQLKRDGRKMGKDGMIFDIEAIWDGESYVLGGDGMDMGDLKRMQEKIRPKIGWLEVITMVKSTT